MSLQSEIKSLEASLKEIQNRLMSVNLGSSIKDRTARLKFIQFQKAGMNKAIVDIQSRIEGLKAQILTEVEENAIIPDLEISDSGFNIESLSLPLIIGGIAVLLLLAKK